MGRSGGPTDSPQLYTVLTTFQVLNHSLVTIAGETPADIYLSGLLSQSQVLDVIKHLESDLRLDNTPNKFMLIFRGLVSWDPWQLVQEIARGSWRLCFAWPMDILYVPPSALW